MDLITNPRARVNLPNAPASDDTAIDFLISAASRAIIRYCQRDFVSTTYDELYNGNAERRLVLRQYPLLSVQSVRYRPVTVMKAINNQLNTPQARVQVTSTGLNLITVTNGAMTTQAVNFAGNPTIATLVAAVNALGNGWFAQSMGYDAWPSGDLYCPNGIAGSAGPLPATQGALAAAGQNAELKMHTYELAGYQLDPRRGWLLRAVPYTDPELLHPEDLVWPVGINNFRVQYTAGYAAVPEDVQEACAELTATYYQQRGRDLSLASEDIANSYRYTAENFDQLPQRVLALLRPYRNYHILHNQS